MKANRAQYVLNAIPNPIGTPQANMYIGFLEYLYGPVVMIFEVVSQGSTAVSCLLKSLAHPKKLMEPGR